jgi:hypothetical protein
MWQKGGWATVVNALLLILALFTGSMLTSSGNAEEEPDRAAVLSCPDWWQVKKDLLTALVAEKTDLASLAAKHAAQQPKTVKEALLKVCLLMRAGMNREAIAALKELETLYRTPGSFLVDQIYHEAAEETQAWNVAQAVAETFAGNWSLKDGLLKHFLDSGWSVERVDQWLASRPPGQRNFWVKQRLLFNRAYGQEEPLALALADTVKAYPRDSKGVIAFLDILYDVGPTPLREGELSWLVVLAKPDRATEARDIADGLKTIHSYQEAVEFYRRALDIPLTDEETQGSGRKFSVKLLPDQVRAIFAVTAREELVECLIQLKRNDEAQAAMVEAADLRKRHNLGDNALFAGDVQAATGRRTIEERIKKEEQASEDDPEYWSERARYYEGRKETGLEEDALKKGLALTASQSAVGQRDHDLVKWRSGMLCAYARFLVREKRIPKAFALLHKEVEERPADANSTMDAVHMLADSDFKACVEADDELLWTWLASRPWWDDYTEESLLRRMLERVTQDGLEKYFARAEGLAKDKHPSRACALGRVMNRLQCARRAIPLLESAVQRAAEEPLKERAVFALLDSFLTTGDWKQAERVLPEARTYLGLDELTSWLSRIAVVAAKAGAKDDTVRLWRTVVALNPSDFRNLNEIVNAGLKDELAQIYRELQQKLPTSTVPLRARTKMETTDQK